MRMRSWAGLVLALLVSIGIDPALAQDRDVPMDRAMEGFAKIEPGQLHLVLRVPLDLLRAISFPMRDGNYDPALIGPARDEALRALAGDVVLWADDEKLVPDHMTGRLTGLDDYSFSTYETAAAHIEEPPAPDTPIPFELGYLDAHLTYPLAVPDAVLTIHSKVGQDLGDMITLTMHYQPVQGASRSILLTGDAGRVNLNPAWYQVIGGFAVLGLDRVMSGADHLLLLICLVIPLRRAREVMPVALAFILGQTVGLIGFGDGSAFEGDWFQHFIGTAIAAAIFAVAIENAAGTGFRRRWIAAMLLGLIQGFGFPGVLSEKLQFAGAHPLLSRLSFDLGMAAGEIAVLCLCMPVLFLILRGVLAGRTGIILLSVIAGHAAWHWMIDRGEILWRTPWPPLSQASLIQLAAWLFIVAAAIGAALVLARRIESRRPPFLPSARTDFS